MCVNCRGLIGINLGCDLWGKLDLHYFLTRIKWRPCGYMNSLLGCNRWAWMCSLGKLSVTSVSSKFWWSQPINRGEEGVGVGRSLHSPQPRPRQKCLCLEMGSGWPWPAAVRLALIVIIQMENVAYKLFVYHSEDNMIFLIWPEERALLQLVSYFRTISLERVFTPVSFEAGCWCCCLPVYVVHSHVTKPMNSKTKQRYFS